MGMISHAERAAYHKTFEKVLNFSKTYYFMEM